MTPIARLPAHRQGQQAVGHGPVHLRPAAGRLDAATITQSADITVFDSGTDFAQTIEATMTFKLVK